MRPINIDPIPLFDFKNGDQVTASAVNTTAIEVYNKYNFLNPNNVQTINTGQFLDVTNSMYYPNYCGWLDNAYARPYEMDIIVAELTSDINEVIATYTGD